MKVVEMQGVYKFFGDFCANENVNFDLEEGEIHALLGENGAGKSTLMNILYGLYSHDSGTIKLNGKTLEIKTPNDAISHGVGMVHQHFALIPQLTVTQNIFLGMKETGFVLDMKSLEKRVSELNSKYGFNVSPGAVIWQLPVGVQQKVEILKILMRKAKILILDEPTAVLTPNEVEELFVSIKKLTGEGCSVILITHKMEDVLTYTDRVTVLRTGKVIGTVNSKDTNMDELATMMVGRHVSLDRKTVPQETGEVRLSVKELTVNNEKGLAAVDNVSFEVLSGEIFGIAGVDGNGQLELGEAISGLRKFISGTVALCGSGDLHIVNPKDLISRGMGHIPDDRHKKGLVLPFSVKENMILGSHRSNKYCSGLFIKSQDVDNHAKVLVDEFDVRPRDIDKEAGNLSGGNQQKVILAREFDRNPKVLLAIQPTRGLDIGAIEFVHEKIIEARANGVAVLLISTDLDEIRTLSDRIAVMFEGKLSKPIPFDTAVNELGLMMAGVQRESPEVYANAN